jgi:DNA-binding MarR family transcriptional regulator
MAVDRDARRLTEVVTRLRRVLRSSIRADYPWESLPMAQIELLQTLAETDGARVGELAALLRLAPNSVSTLVMQLTDAGLASRGVDPADRRAARLSITDAGRERLEGWEQAHVRRISAALRTLTPDERERVAAALPALNALVDALDDR